MVQPDKDSEWLVTASDSRQLSATAISIFAENGPVSRTGSYADETMLLFETPNGTVGAILGAVSLDMSVTISRFQWRWTDYWLPSLEWAALKKHTQPWAVTTDGFDTNLILNPSLTNKNSSCVVAQYNATNLNKGMYLNRATLLAAHR